VDLHAFVPPQFTSSIARSIWGDGAFTYVAGQGYNATNGRLEALMWVSPEPASGLVLACGSSGLRDAQPSAEVATAFMGHSGSSMIAVNVLWA
jgi:hypothetical protein